MADPNEAVAQQLLAEVISDVHVLRLEITAPSPKASGVGVPRPDDPRTLVRAICSCGDYSSAVDTPPAATRAWVAHWQAKTRGIGR